MHPESVPASATGSLSAATALPLSAGLVAAAALMGMVLLGPQPRAGGARPTAPPPAEAFDHSAFFSEPFQSGPAVTRACLSCHTDAAAQVMRTPHWTWGGHRGTNGIGYGKRNLLNNFCIGVQSNWARCTSCHVGYGWRDETFLETATEAQVDCLVCHAKTSLYSKAPAGAGDPAEGVDLLAAARSVGPVRRSNCGTCHFAGGGGDAVKHGDLDGTMHTPSARIDVHMGRQDMQCTACHRSRDHQLQGRLAAQERPSEGRIACADCHRSPVHSDERIARHEASVACQACHIPLMAIDAPTKLSWDWEQAGQDPAQVAALDSEVAADPHLYNKLKGRFTYGREVAPEYRWYDGSSRRLLPGERIDAAGTVAINAPQGDISDPAAKIHPFKVHRGRQPYDREHAYLLVPKTYGPGGYWTDFNWDQALRLGAEASGVPYSGSFGFVSTEMFWPLHHMVQPQERALQCGGCHGAEGRLDWSALGYPGDPARHGGRAARGLLRPREGAK